MVPLRAIRREASYPFSTLRYRIPCIDPFRARPQSEDFGNDGVRPHLIILLIVSVSVNAEFELGGRCNAFA